MIDRLQPRSGDIVVSQQQRGAQLVYILRPLTGPDQILVRSREIALGQAMSIAARQNVRVWLTSDGRNHVPVERATPAPDRPLRHDA
jgi:hypothetical protein